MPPTALAFALIAALASPPAAPASCTVRLKAVEEARDLAQVKLQEETERADAQAYLIRLELGVTKQRLAAALARCGAACAPIPAAPPSPSPPPR